LTILPLTLKVGSIGGVLRQFLSQSFELDGSGKGPFRRLIAIEIGASELAIGKTGQNLGELLAMVAMGEMDRFVEEDVIQGVIRGELEAI
jgi:hypothetical protein